MLQINSCSNIEIAAIYNVSIVQATQILYGPQRRSIPRRTRYATMFLNSLLIVNLTCTDYWETLHIESNYGTNGAISVGLDYSAKLELAFLPVSSW
jgi:hypothetical protein